MSLANATRLLNAVLTDEATRDRLASLGEAGLAAAGADLGLPCTIAELQQAAATLATAGLSPDADGLLSDADLDTIAGGITYPAGGPTGAIGKLFGKLPLGNTIGGSAGGLGRLLPFSAAPTSPPEGR